MIAYYKSENMSLDKTKRMLDHRIILKNGNTDICINKESAYELRSSLSSALITLAIAESNEAVEINNNGDK